MRYGKRGGLLGKRKRKFPDQNDGRIYKNRERAVLEFTRKIAADPGIEAQDRPLPLRPTARHIGEHRQDRQFIIIIPKNERIVPEKKQAEEDDDKSCCYRADNFRTRGARSGHLKCKTPNVQPQKQTPNAQLPTSNVELRRSVHHLAFLLVGRILAMKIRISSSTSFKDITRFAGKPSFSTRPTSRNHRFVSRSSFRQIRSL